MWSVIGRDRSDVGDYMDNDCDKLRSAADPDPDMSHFVENAADSRKSRLERFIANPCSNTPSQKIRFVRDAFFSGTVPNLAVCVSADGTQQFLPHQVCFKYTCQERILNFTVLLDDEVAYPLAGNSSIHLAQLPFLVFCAKARENEDTICCEATHKYMNPINNSSSRQLTSAVSPAIGSTSKLTHDTATTRPGHYSSVAPALPEDISDDSNIDSDSGPDFASDSADAFDGCEGKSVLLWNAGWQGCGTSQSKVDAAILVDGRAVSTQDLIINHCTNDGYGHFCAWTNTEGVPLAHRPRKGGNQSSGWVLDSPRWWNSAPDHAPPDIADGINFVASGSKVTNACNTSVLSGGSEVRVKGQAGMTWAAGTANKSCWDRVSAAEAEDGDEGCDRGCNRSLGGHNAVSNSKGRVSSGDGDHILSFPIYVLSNPSLPERAMQTVTLLRAVGLTGPLTMLPFTRAADLDMEALRKEGLIDYAHLPRLLASGWIGPGGLRAYLAAAVDHLRGLEAGADAGHALFGVFEDDIMPAAAPANVQKRLAAALAAAPASADLLRLEGCFESCSARRLSQTYPLWARTAGADCSAAILFTLQGARRVLALCKPIFWGIDNMYAALARAGLLEAYALVPHVFFQDGFWPSGVQTARLSLPTRKFGDRALPYATHRPLAAECNEHNNAFQFTIAQVSAATPFLLNCLAPGWGSPPTAVLIISDPLCLDPSATSSAIFFLENSNKSWVEVGRWPVPPTGVNGAVLWLSERTGCQQADDKCTVRVLCSDHSGGRMTESLVPISSLLVARKDVHEMADFLVAGTVADPTPIYCRNNTLS